MRRALCLCLLVCLPVAAQEIPRSTELPSDPFYVKKSWFIGGIGSWGFLAMDFQARRLFIARGATVQVVDVDSGSLTGEITGFREAYAIALDNAGEFGYVSDELADDVKVFNRRTRVIEAAIPVFCSPRSIAFEPQSQLVIAICGAAGGEPAAPPSSAPPPGPPSTGPPSSGHRPAAGANAAHPSEKPEPTNLPGTSHVVAIDAESRTVVADMLMPGDFRFAQPDGDGHVYVSVGEARFTWVADGKTGQEFVPQRIARLNAPAIAAEAQRQMNEQAQPSSPPGQAESPRGHAVAMDWTYHEIPASLGRFLPLDSACRNPQGLATDSKHDRLFAACDNQRFVVLNAGTGDLVASLTTGPGDAAIAYDQDRGLLFVANGGGYGSLTIVRQDANTDSYAVIQNLPTQERTRTIAVDPSTGLVYLVTDFRGVDLTQMGGIGTLHSNPVPDSFHVLVVGH